MHAPVSVGVREKSFRKHLKCHSKQLHVSVGASVCNKPAVFFVPVSPPTLIPLPCCCRWNYECDPGPALRLLHHHLLSGGHHLHTAGGALLCGLHRRHPAHPHLHQSGA